MPLDNSCINLQPGEVYFSTPQKNHAIKKLTTILGSCVAVTIWHSKSKAAGMCHYLLPQEASNNKATQVMKKYSYGEEALNYLLKNMTLRDPLDEYELALYGGSNMYPNLVYPAIGKVNVLFAKVWAKKNKLSFNKEDVLGNDSRSLTLDLSTGNISLTIYKDSKGAFGEH